MSADAVTSYDEVPYPNWSFYYTQPDCLATMAALYGMAAAPADHCRVLELGCAQGGNLIPMALSQPESRFLGIDLSQRQVAAGQIVVEKLGLRNIELRSMSILDLDEGFGRFDYIICHGVYSWVAEEVRDKILAVCRQNLAPQGVAYVSYNTYPGWHLRAVLRDLLVFHVRESATPLSRVQQARAFLDLMARSLQEGKTLYARLLRQETDSLCSRLDAYLAHDHLEEVNYPIYFHEFAAHAAAHGLQYLEEAVQPAFKVPVEVLKTIQQAAPNLIQGEQYLDFLRGRTFRRTLLCHEGVALKRPPDVQTVRRCHLTTRLRPQNTDGFAKQSSATRDTVEEFQTEDGVSLSTDNPLLRAAFHHLFDVLPRAVPFEALWDAVLSHLDETLRPGAEIDLFAGLLLQCYLGGLLELHLQPPRFACEVSERPLASPLARLQAQNGDCVTNLRHYPVALNSLDRQILQLLDGSHDRRSILESLADCAESLEPCLRRLAGNALLMG